jgi:hypothetical protein
MKRFLPLALAAALLAPAAAEAQLTTLRTLTTQASEGLTAPSSASFVDINALARYVEVSFATGGSVANTPDSVDICIWYLVGSTVVLASKQTIDADDISAPASVLLDVYARKLYATACGFTAGSTPTVTLTVKARPR